MYAFDKESQRRAAKQFTENLEAQGLKPAILTWPEEKVVPKIEPIKTSRLRSGRLLQDMVGAELKIDDMVVYTFYNVSQLFTGKVIGFSKSKKSVLIRGFRRTYRGAVEREFYKPITRVVKIKHM